MPWIIGVVVFVAVLAIVVVAVRFESARNRARVELWRRFAEERGFRFIPAAGPWYRQNKDAIDGTCEGTPFRLDTYVVSTGKSHMTFTRARAQLERAFPGKLTLARRNVFTRMGEALGRKSLSTHDGVFDQRFVARSSAGDSAQRVFDDDVRSRAMAFPRAGTLEVRDREAKLTWHNHETDAAVLDAAGRLIAALARACARA